MSVFPLSLLCWIAVTFPVVALSHPVVILGVNPAVLPQQAARVSKALPTRPALEVQGKPSISNTHKQSVVMGEVAAEERVAPGVTKTWGEEVATALPFFVVVSSIAALIIKTFQGKTKQNDEGVKLLPSLGKSLIVSNYGVVGPSGSNAAFAALSVSGALEVIEEKAKSVSKSVSIDIKEASSTDFGNCLDVTASTMETTNKPAYPEIVIPCFEPSNDIVTAAKKSKCVHPERKDPSTFCPDCPRRTKAAMDVTGAPVTSTVVAAKKSKCVHPERKDPKTFCQDCPRRK